MKKIKILLGAYVDLVNAQNINCLEIAKRLNNNIFEIHVLYHNEIIHQRQGLIYHKVRTNRILRNIDKMRIMIFGKFDIYYLPRIDKVDYIFARIFGENRCLTSSIEIENVVCKDRFKRYFNSYMFDYFSISEFLRNKVREQWNKNSEVIYLGCNHPIKNIKYKEKVSKIAFVGSVTERKRPFLFLECAKRFPEVAFTVVGSGDLLDKVKGYISDNNINNVNLTGQVSNNEVYSYLYENDLLLILSEVEGLPKIALEAASVATPTIYINKKYNIDYINNGVNGIGVQTFDEVIQQIQLLIEDESKLRMLSKKSLEMSKNYDWDKLISSYNNFFNDIYARFSIRNS